MLDISLKKRSRNEKKRLAPKNELSIPKLKSHMYNEKVCPYIEEGHQH
jgi:hypothetical protein